MCGHTVAPCRGVTDVAPVGSITTAPRPGGRGLVRGSGSRGRGVAPRAAATQVCWFIAALIGGVFVAVWRTPSARTEASQNGGSGSRAGPLPPRTPAQGAPTVPACRAFITFGIRDVFLRARTYFHPVAAAARGGNVALHALLLENGSC